MKRFWWLGLALAACKGDETDTADTSDPDTTDTSDTSDTDTTDTDTGPPPCDQFAFGGDFEVPDDVAVPSGTATIGMFPFTFGDSVPTWDRTYATATVALPAAGASAPYELCFPAEPGDEWLVDMDGDTGTDTDTAGRMAMFMVGAWMDDDEDGAFDAGETVVGATVRFVVYAEGVLPPDAEVLGAELGWNVLYFDLANMDAGPTSAVPFQSGFDGYDLPANLLMSDYASVEGVVSPAGPGTVNVSLYHATDILAITPPVNPQLTDVVVDVTSPGASFSLPLFTPPADHVATSMGDGPGGAEVALYYGMAWEDMDEDGVFEDGSDPYIAHSLGAGDASRLVAWIRPTSFEAVFFAEMFGGVGWQLLRIGAENEPPAAADWDLGLVLGDQFGG